MDNHPRRTSGNRSYAPRSTEVDRAAIVDLHPAVRAMVVDGPPEYSPDLAVVQPKMLLDVARAHPIGVVPIRGQQGQFHCVTSIRLYRRLWSLKSWPHPVPVLVFEKLSSRTLFSLAQIDFYFTPYLAGPPASARHAHAAVWAEAQSACQLSASPGLTGQAMLAAVHHIDERPLHGKTQTRLRDRE